MNRRFFSWNAIATGLVLAASLPLEATEAEQPPTANKGAPEPDALARAQRDFDTIKATRNGTLLPARPDVPRVAVPEWQGAPVPGPRVPLKTPSSDTKSSTWLIDAMKRESATTESRKGGRDERGRVGASDERVISSDRLGENELNATAPSPQPDARETADRTDRTRSVQVVNPLTRYLGEWMTPQDYQLLKPGLTESLGQRSELRREVPAFDATTLAGGLPIGGADRSPMAPTPPSAASSAAMPRENPYLQSLTAPPPVALAPSPRVPPPAPILSSPTPMGVTPANPIAPSKIPEFARPANDEKYFKQLKRF